MAHTYILFDFGTDEEKAQQARHKLEGWKQAFRLDKKLQFKFERGEAPAAELPAKADKSKPKGTKGKEKAAETLTEPNGTVKLLVRLYFSGHEKLSELRWLDRIPADEPFKGASPKVIHADGAEFAAVVKQFEALD
jgi:hypothetical protein